MFFNIINCRIEQDKLKNVFTNASLWTVIATLLFVQWVACTWLSTMFISASLSNKKFLACILWASTSLIAAFASRKIPLEFVPAC